MTSAEDKITHVLSDAKRSMSLVEITDALNKSNSRPRPYTYDEIRGQLEQMDEVHESRGTYCLKG
jgi:hypothetical protein